MKTNKKVSVIIPVYNAEKFIEKCIKSVLIQDYNNIEIIVVNDGSTDGSEKKLTQFMKKIVYVKQKNAGGSSARNVGLKLATGEYILFLDADDILLPEAINNLVKNIDNCDLCIGNYVEISISGRILKNVNRFFQKTYYSSDNLPELYTLNPNPSTKLYRMDIIKKNDITFAQLSIAQDLNFYLKYLLCCDSAVGIDNVIYGYRIVQNSISRTYNERLIDIIKTFDDVKRFAIAHNYRSDVIEKHLGNVELKHICYQFDKLRYVRDYKIKRIIEKKLKHRALKIRENKWSPTYVDCQGEIMRMKLFCYFGYSRLCQIVGNVIYKIFYRRCYDA